MSKGRSALRAIEAIGIALAIAGVIAGAVVATTPCENDALRANIWGCE